MPLSAPPVGVGCARSLTLRVEGWHGYLHQWTKALTMFRADLDDDAQFFTQSLNNSGFDWLYYRAVKGGQHTEISNAQLNPGDGAAVWARLTRVGNSFSEEYSADGVNWQFHGPSTGTYVALPVSGYVGFGVSSKSNDYLSEIVYSNVSLVTNSQPDTTPPTISNVTVEPLGDSATIHWTTDEATNGTVNYGLSAAYGSAAFMQPFVVEHEITLTALTPNTPYHFSITSADIFSNTTSSGDFSFDSGAAVDTSLPPEWSSIDLGAPGNSPGSATHLNGVFTVSGGGGDLWGSHDRGHFMYQTVAGDFELIAVVDGYAGDVSSAFAKAALMFKEDVGGAVPTASAPGIYQSLNHSAADYWYERDANGISSYNATNLNSSGGSAWLRLTRSGNTFRSYSWNSSSASWVQHGGDRIVALNSNGFVGLAATSTNSGLLDVSFSAVVVN